jgi:hypothetical protein
MHLLIKAESTTVTSYGASQPAPPFRKVKPPDSLPIPHIGRG